MQAELKLVVSAYYRDLPLCSVFQILGPPPGKAPAAGAKDGNLSLSPRHLVAPLCLQDTAEAALARGSRVTAVWCGLPASRVTVTEAADVGSL